MSRFKILALIALFTFALGLVLAGEAVAAEKWKGRTVKYTVKWEPINVGDAEGHVIAVYEQKQIMSQIEEGSLGEARVGWEVGVVDMNVKTGHGDGHGCGESTGRDGSKIFYQWKGRLVEPGHWESEVTYTGGTGKYEGIQGKGRSSAYILAPNQSYADWEYEVELPER